MYAQFSSAGICLVFGLTPHLLPYFVLKIRKVLVKLHIYTGLFAYSKTCVKQPLKYRQNKDLNDKW